ncbi:MAG: (d)CMP kinase [Crocinitomicaceae bacterium]|nr:(d)CMP kinase [Crocinitomicaceae bacterium]
MKKLTIAIDGFSSCGKSTLAKDLAKELNYIFVDSGAMYRGIAFFALQNKLIIDGVIHTDLLINRLDEINLEFVYNKEKFESDLLLNGVNISTEIRKPDVAAIVSKIAVLKEVRSKLVSTQQKLGEFGGIIMDGRDIGTVVFPKADIKLFVTADPKIRAERRFKELLLKDLNTSLVDITANLEERDLIDTTRKISPLVKAEDAIELDNSNLTRESQLQFVLDLIKERFNTL